MKLFKNWLATSQPATVTATVSNDAGDVSIKLLSLRQLKILLLLNRGHMLKHAMPRDAWIDTYDGGQHSNADCQWLLDKGYLELVAKLRDDEVFKLSQQALDVLESRTAPRRKNNGF